MAHLDTFQKAWRFGGVIGKRFKVVNPWSTIKVGGSRAFIAEIKGVFMMFYFIDLALFICVLCIYIMSS